MSYQVLARRWRPKTFSELVGQEHVVRALSNALENDRLHHAYLFTGTRGVGKTTIARILAKSLNCEQGVSAHPCGECSVCREVDEGRFVDLIDEVHMFSGHSFNALLKTLEEPPPHVKFLLATTDPQKVPVTVLSRCLQFSLNRLPIDQIQAQFAHILEAEQTGADDEALYLLARAADGSMRDGLSLLDQAIAFGGGAVRTDEVRDMLGVSASDRLPALLQEIQQADGAAVLAGVEALAERTPDFAALLKELLLLLHRLALLHAAPGAWQASWGDRARFDELVQALSPEDVQLYYQIALVGQRDLPLAPDMRSGFEMILLRMLAFRPAETTASVEPAPGERPVSPRPSVSGETSTAGAAPVTNNEQRPAAVPEGATGEVEFSDWHGVLPHLRLTGMAAQLANHSMVRAWDGRILTLTVDENCASMLGSLAEKRLLEALEQYAGQSLRLEWERGAAEDTPAERQQMAREQRQQQAENDIANDPLVQALQDTFDAELVEESIRPTEH